MASGDDAQHIGRVAVVGTGLIGSRLAALLLARGLSVTATDPAPGAEERLRGLVRRVWPILGRLGAAPGVSPDDLAFHQALEGAVAEADFVMECAPDDEELKADLLAEIDMASPSARVIASSSSGIIPSALQKRCGRPERVLVCHPFNPAHIVPLVEVVGGRSTSDEAVHTAMAFYRRLGKTPLHVRREIPGYIGSRLLEAVYCEMFHLIDEDVATTEEIDVAMREGQGLRYALFGPAMVYWMQGGDAGLASALRQFDPARTADWSYNTCPALTPELISKLENQTDRQTAGRSLRELEDLRDEFLVRLLELRREFATRVD